MVCGPIEPSTPSPPKKKNVVILRFRWCETTQLFLLHMAFGSSLQLNSLLRLTSSVRCEICLRCLFQYHTTHKRNVTFENSNCNFFFFFDRATNMRCCVGVGWECKLNASSMISGRRLRWTTWTTIGNSVRNYVNEKKKNPREIHEFFAWESTESKESCPFKIEKQPHQLCDASSLQETYLLFFCFVFFVDDLCFWHRQLNYPSTLIKWSPKRSESTKVDSILSDLNHSHLSLLEMLFSFSNGFHSHS